VRLNSRVEVIELKRSKDWYIATVAVNGRKAWSFDIHESDWHEMDERQKDLYLERSAITLLNRYGDAREIRVREDGQIVPRFGEAEAGI